GRALVDRQGRRLAGRDRQAVGGGVDGDVIEAAVSRGDVGDRARVEVALGHGVARRAGRLGRRGQVARRAARGGVDVVVGDRERTGDRDVAGVGDQVGVGQHFPYATLFRSGRALVDRQGRRLAGRDRQGAGGGVHGGVIEA